MGRNLHRAVRTEGSVPEFDRLLEPRERRRLTESRTVAFINSSELAEWPAACFCGVARTILAIKIRAIMFACCAVFMLAMLAVPDATRAAETSTLSNENENSESACDSIKTALHALSAAEHDEALALDLAAEGGSAAIVEARLSGLLDRTQDLRAVLKRVRKSAVARDPTVDQCTRMGFLALVLSDKLNSDVA